MTDLSRALAILDELDAAHKKARDTMFGPDNWGYLDAAVWDVRQRLRRELEATSDSEEALSGVARDLDVPCQFVMGLTGAACGESEAAMIHRQGWLGARYDRPVHDYFWEERRVRDRRTAVAAPLDPERLARALHLTYGYTFPNGGLGDWASDARFVAAAYRDAKP